jgi:hypothetical protein
MQMQRKSCPSHLLPLSNQSATPAPPPTLPLRSPRAAPCPPQRPLLLYYRIGMSPECISPTFVLSVGSACEALFPRLRALGVPRNQAVPGI